MVSDMKIEHIQIHDILKHSFFMLIRNILTSQTTIVSLDKFISSVPSSPFPKH